MIENIRHDQYLTKDQQKKGQEYSRQRDNTTKNNKQTKSNQFTAAHTP